MTLKDLLERINWDFADDDWADWTAKIAEGPEIDPETRKRSKEALLDAALHLLICNNCAWVGFREEKCPNCRKPVSEHWQGRFWARKVLGPAWPQAVDILENASLVL